MPYKVILDRRNSRRIQACAPALRQRMAALHRLEDDPRFPGALKLSGLHLWRVRVGDYRIIDAIDDDSIVRVIRAGHRRDIYRSLEDDG